MKLISWNVNGLRSILDKGFRSFVRKQGADVLCVQETRCEPEDVELGLSQYEAHFCSGSRKGYSGTAIFTREPTVSAHRGIGRHEHDGEGRVLTCELPRFFVVSVYTPNSQRSLARLPYRVRWDRAFLAYLRRLERTKPVVFCGDLNVAHREIDLANPRANRGTHGFTDEERAGFARLLDAGYVDTFRMFEQGPGHYTWWSQRPGVRERNIGWRLDYILVSRALASCVRSASILTKVRGSDHAPVALELELELEQEVPLNRASPADHRARPRSRPMQ